jgi:hypothetical protein
MALVFVPALGTLLDLSGCRDQTIAPGFLCTPRDPAGYPVAVEAAGPTRKSLVPRLRID